MELLLSGLLLLNTFNPQFEMGKEPREFVDDVYSRATPEVVKFVTAIAGVWAIRKLLSSHQ